MGDIIMSIASAVAGYLVAPIGRQLHHLFSYHGNVEDLRSQLARLGDMRGRVERDVIAARRNGDEIEPDVEKWLKSVDGITEDAEKLLDDEDRAKKRCFNGLCPNLKSRFQLSKKAKKTTQEVVRMQGDGKFDSVSYPAPPPGIGHTSIKGYEAFESRMPILNDIMEALSTPSINMIGVYGMGGVGKTTLVKEVAKQAEEERLFNQVVMAEVLETPDLKEIRGTIADMLGLKFDQASEPGRADRLRERLKKEKKILVILDNIWGRINLEAVGIPFGDDHVGCKILLTSRSQEVLCNQMDTQKDFGIGVLPKEEAWTLFKKMAGDSVEDPDLQPTAFEVTEKCAGLPIAIVTVARALKNKPLFVWKDALQQLQRSNQPNIPGMQANVYASLELSYNNLESEELKSLFLLCGLFITSQSSSVEDLLKYGMGLGLFRDINTMEEARYRVHTLIHNLKASCLLLDGDNRFVKMHDVVHDVAISIASREQSGCMVRYGVGLKEWPKKHILKNCTAISLPASNIHELPEWLECPLLEFFYLASQDPGVKVPDTFFEETKELKVLDLTHIHFSSLPSSLILLANLQTLCLDQCMLGDIAVIGELKSLEILSFAGSDIVQLPREIGKLTHLRLLSLRNCSKLRVIPPNVISSLSRLEELWMGNSSVQWEAEGPNNQRCNASLDELKNLSCLIALEVHIPNAEILPKGFLFENLIRYRILIGDVWNCSERFITPRTLKLKLNTSIHLEDGVKMLLKRTEGLFLDELMGVKNLLYELDRDGFRQLKVLHVQSNPEIQHIIDSMKWVPSRAFPVLECLFLSNLTSLEEICRGRLPVESFSKLRIINVESCDRLKNLFSLSQARGLLQLQEMEITECKIMDGIVSVGKEEEGNDEVMDNILFPQLRRLTLERLPKLVSFCSIIKTVPSVPQRRQQISTTDVGSNEIVSESEHDIPVSILDEKVAFPSLEFLKLSELPMLKQIWHDQPPVASCNLLYLMVEKCELLLNIASSNLLQSSQNLELITVESCDSVEYVFDLEGLNSDEERVGLLSRFVILKLSKLPRLGCIWNKDPQGILSFRSLKYLDIENCNSLKNLFSLSMALDLVQLRVIRIVNCDMIEDIVEKEKGAREEAIVNIVFPLLRDIILQDLPNLRSFYPGNHSLECPSLKQMLIEHCPKIKTFTSTYVGLQETSGEDYFDMSSAPFFNQKVAFSNFERLGLYDIPSLMIWKKDSQGIFPFQNLSYLAVARGEHLRNIFTTSMAKSLVHLQEILIGQCDLMEEIIEKEGVEEESTEVIVFPQVTSLTLQNLPRLKSFCQGIHISKWPSLKQLGVFQCYNVEIIFASEMISFEETNGKGHLGTPTKQSLFLVDKGAFPSLEYLKLFELSKLKQIWHGQSSVESCNLQQLVVEKCALLPNVISSNFLQSLENLEILTVEMCDSVKHVVDLEGLICDEEHAGYLAHIVELELIGLPRLRCIWNKDPQGILSFQNLKSLKIENCNSLRNPFSLSMALDLVQLRKLRIINCYMMEQIVEKEKKARKKEITRIVFPLLTDITLEDLPNLRSFYPGNHSFECPSLERMMIKRCPKIKTFASTYEGLHEISEEGDFDIPSVPLFNEKVAFPKLELFALLELPSLIAVWKKDSQGIVPFKNLSCLTVGACHHLRNIFTTSIAKSLVQLQQLLIIYCDMVEEIVEEEGAEAATATDNIARIVFPRVISLSLQCLQQLKTFCQGIHISEWPSLKKLVVSWCQKVEIVASELSSFEEICGKGHLGTPWKQPLFLVDKVAFPNLEEMELMSMFSLKEIWQGQFHAQSFCKLRVLKVMDCHEILKVFPISLLCNLQNLEELSVESCFSLGEVFELEGLVGEIGHASTLPQLRELRLIKLPKLMHLWKEASQLSSVFQNLTTLEVSSCGSLTHLLPSTIAESLLQIKSISVADCEMMKEIIASEKGEAKDATTFNQLKSLLLIDLPNLVSFCHGNNTFSFPSLEEVVAEECPKLKTFSNNNVSAPKLEKVRVNENEWLWGGDLNTTIQHLFIRKRVKKPIRKFIRTLEIIRRRGGIIPSKERAKFWIHTTNKYSFTDQGSNLRESGVNNST